jgi:hypothetical protein
MKIIFLLVVLYSRVCYSQTTDLQMTMNGLGKLELGAKQHQVEKILNKKLQLTNPTDTISGSWVDSAKVSYKNIPLTLYFQRDYYDSVNFDMSLYSIVAKSPPVKTNSGIGIGSVKMDIVNKYEMYSVDMSPMWNEESIIKGHSIIYVRSLTEDRMLVFILKNNKVISMETSISSNDGD